MEAGKLRHRISIQTDRNAGANPPVTDDFGQHIPDWQVWVIRPAQEQPLGSREFPAAHKRHEKTTSRFVVRNDSATKAISPAKHRIQHRGKTFDIHGVEPVDGRNIALHIEASEIK